MPTAPPTPNSSVFILLCARSIGRTPTDVLGGFPSEHAALDFLRTVLVARHGEQAVLDAELSNNNFADLIATTIEEVRLWN